MDGTGYFSGILRQIAATAATNVPDLTETIHSYTFIEPKKRIGPIEMKDQCAEYNRKLMNLEMRIRQIKEHKNIKEEEEGNNKLSLLIETNEDDYENEEQTDPIPDDANNSPKPFVSISSASSPIILPADGQYICRFCGKNEHSPYQLNEHIAIYHVKDRSWKCEYCDQSFGRRGGLRRHIQMIHMNMLHKCPYADCTHPGYKCTKALSAHIRTIHTNIRPYSCENCDKTFVRRNDFQNHVLTHKRDSPLRCSCGEEYHRFASLRRHQKDCKTHNSVDKN